MGYEGSMSEVPPSPTAMAKPPWWLITRWGQWAWFLFIYPGMMCYFAIDRVDSGRVGPLEFLWISLLACCVLYGLVQVTMTLLAYRRDPGLRTRTWPTPPPSPGMSRRVGRGVAAATILAVGLLLVIYAGWGAALFVTAILGGLAYAIDRFDLFSEPTPPLGATESRPPNDRDADTPDR